VLGQVSAERVLIRAFGGRSIAQLEGHGLVWGRGRRPQCEKRKCAQPNQYRPTHRAVLATVGGLPQPPRAPWLAPAGACTNLPISVRAYLNDTQFTDATGIDTRPAAGVHNATAGIDLSDQADAAEVFIGELVLETTPIDCWDLSACAM
jgi:hypothetical protein